MESPHIIRLPIAEAVAPDVLAELEAAIDLVASGGARRIALTALPGVEAVAASALAHAQAAGVAFALSRDEPSGPLTVRIGPREA